MSSDSSPQYRLVGAEISLFTAKVRAYLQWKGIPFTQVIASDGVYKTIIRPLTNVSFIPVLLLPTTPPTAVQDSRIIIRYIEQHHPNTRHPVVPSSPVPKLAALLTELLADQWLVIHAMYWRWGPGVFSQQSTFITSEFADTSLGGRKSTMSERMKAARSTQKFAGMLPPLGVGSGTIPAIRAQFSVLLGLLSTHFEENRYFLGNRISIADFALYGPFYAHLFRDPVPGFVIKTQFPAVAEWIERVGGLGRGGAKGVEMLTAAGGWTTEEPEEESRDIPQTAKAVLRLLMGDYLPVLEGECKALSAFVEKGGEKVPRKLGEQAFGYNSGDGVEGRGTRAIGTHGVWILQEILKDGYAGNETEWDGLVKELVGSENSASWKNCVGMLSKPWRLERKDNRLVVVKRPESSKL